MKTILVLFTDHESLEEKVEEFTEKYPSGIYDPFRLTYRTKEVLVQFISCRLCASTRAISNLPANYFDEVDFDIFLSDIRAYVEILAREKVRIKK